MLTLLVQGFGKSLEIFTLTLLGSLPLGLLVMFGRRSRVAPLRWLVKLFISVMRGTPLMLQLMVVYYGPFLLFDFTPPGNWRFGAVIVGFVINYAAYFAEIYRAGYESIPVGQFEAAQVLGLTRGQTFFRITLPLTFPGIFSAVILVFIPSLGIYTVSDMLGGGKVLYIGNIIKNQFGAIRNWPLGAALSVLLLVITGLLIFIYTRFAKIEDMEVV